MVSFECKVADVFRAEKTKIDMGAVTSYASDTPPEDLSEEAVYEYLTR